MYIGSLKLHIAAHTKAISSTFSNINIDISVARVLKVLILLMTYSTRSLTLAVALVLLTSKGSSVKHLVFLGVQ